MFFLALMFMMQSDATIAKNMQSAIDAAIAANELSAIVLTLSDGDRRVLCHLSESTTAIRCSRYMLTSRDDGSFLAAHVPQSTYDDADTIDVVVAEKAWVEQ